MTHRQVIYGVARPAEQAAQPQRAFYKALPLIALGFFDDAFAYRAAQPPIRPVATQAAQPQRAYYKQPRLLDEPEEVRQPARYPLRVTSFQTVGQPWLTWKKAARLGEEFEPEPFDARRPTNIHQFRVGYQTVGQPFWTWRAPAKLGEWHEPEAYDARRPTDVHRFRVGYQTVGQPWLLFARKRVDLSAFEVDEHRYPAVRYVPQSAPPAATYQPLWRLYVPVRADIQAEPDPARVDYSAQMFFNRSTVAAPPELTGGEWIIRARRRRSR